MLLGDGVLIARLRDIDPRLIQFLARQRALIKEQLAAFEYFFLRVESLLGLLCIGFGLLNFFGQAGGGGGLVAGLSLLVRALGVLRSRRKIAVFQYRQQLPLAHRAATLHQEFLYRGGDLWHDGCLLFGEQDGLRGDRVLNGLLSRRGRLGP